MENASKALLIAVGVLIVILIVTIGIKILSPIEGTKQSAAEVGQSLSEKTSSAISSILGIEEKIPETPDIYFDVIQSSGALTLSDEGKEAIEAGKLTEINIPSKIGNIEIKTVYGFKGYNQIKKIYISEGITEINQYAFENCTNITQITLPTTLSKIGTNAFRSVGSATTEGIKELKIPNGVEIIQNETFAGAKIKRVIIPSSVTTINAGAFRDSSIEEVVIEGKGLQTISNYAFRSCGHLKKINLPEGLLKIGEQAFYICPYINTIDGETPNITIPSTVTNIGNDAFSGCKNTGKFDIYMSITEKEGSESQITYGSNWHGGGTIHWK